MGFFHGFFSRILFQDSFSGFFFRILFQDFSLDSFEILLRYFRDSFSCGGGRDSTNLLEDPLQDRH